MLICSRHHYSNCSIVILNKDVIGGLLVIDKIHNGTVRTTKFNWNDFRIENEIGRGGMSSVFKAKYVGIGAGQLEMNRSVAIKVLRDDLSHDSKLKARFQNELKVLMQLKHPNILEVYGWLNSPQGHFGIVTEFIEGHDLKTLSEMGSFSGKLDLIRNVSMKLLDGLSYLHQLGIIHRDLKPSNIVISRTNNVKIIDFGISKLMDSNIDLTRTNATLGTIFYMSPEQIDDSKTVNERTDIYSFGVVLWELINGHKPYKDSNSHASIISSILNKNLPQTQTSFDEIIQKCTRKVQSERYGSVSEVISALKRIKNLDQQEQKKDKQASENSNAILDEKETVADDSTVVFEKTPKSKRVKIGVYLYLLLVVSTLVLLALLVNYIQN
jgi:serine/threonine protein kinase